jgi:hypothetical protein
VKALVVKIKDAGIFNNSVNKKDGSSYLNTKDKVVDITGINKRTEFLEVGVNTFYYKHVANLIRVLFGERPIPSFRKIYNDVYNADNYEEKAKKSRVKIETETFAEDKFHDKSYFLDEVFTARKSIKDSWSTSANDYILDGECVSVKGGLWYHDRLRRYLGDSLYEEYTLLVKEFGNVKTIQEGIELLNINKNNEKVIEFCQKCINSRKTSLYNVITNEAAESISSHYFSKNYPLNFLMICNGIERIKKVSATIYIPVSEEDLEKVKNSTGVATFLEGGLATVEEVVPWTEYLEECTTEIMY